MEPNTEKDTGVDPAPTSNTTGAATIPSNEKQLAIIVYALQALAFFTGLTAIAGVIINYVKRGDITNPVIKAHFDWQIKTFWWCLGLGLVGMVLSIIGIGFIVLIGVAIWYIYRLIMGFIKLNDNQPV
jgi:uncharacterized membrane protein